MTALIVAYRNRRTTFGNAQSVTPAGMGRTPQNIVTGAGTTNVYNAANLTEIKTIAPLGFVENELTIAAANTGRSIHLYGFDPDATNLIVDLRSYIDFRYFVEGADEGLHRIDSYIWNNTLLAWERLDLDSTATIPRTLEGDANGPDMSDYIDDTGSPHAADVIWILLWDFEGTHNSVAGCLAAGEKVWTSQGPVPVEDIACGALTTGHMDGEDVNREVVDVTTHPIVEPREIVRIETECGSVGLSPCHYIPTDSGDKQAGAIVPGDLIQSINGWAAVTSAVQGFEETTYHDISPNCANYYVNDGLLINRTI